MQVIMVEPATDELFLESIRDHAPNPLRLILPFASVSSIAVIVAVFVVMDVPGFLWAVVIPSVLVADGIALFVIYRVGKKSPKTVRVTGEAVYIEHDGISQTRIPIRDITSVETRVVTGETQVIISQPSVADPDSRETHTVVRSNRPDELVAAIEWARTGSGQAVG